MASKHESISGVAPAVCRQHDSDHICPVCTELREAVEQEYHANWHGIEEESNGCEGTDYSDLN